MSNLTMIGLRKKASSASAFRSLARILLWCLCPVFVVMLLAVRSVTLFDGGVEGAGDLDPTFGVGGQVTTAIGLTDRARAVALQRDGKILAAGWAAFERDGEYGVDFALVRYTVDGALDPTFGNDGQVLTNLRDYDIASALAVQPDGRIVVVGYSYTGPACDFALVRYHADGRLDTTFGHDGQVLTDFGAVEYAFAAAIQPDDKILVAGLTFQSAANEMKFALARYHADGSLDTGFGSGGKVRTAVGDRASAHALALQPDGKIVAAGDTYTYPDVQVAVVRYNSDGSLDTGFDEDGIVTTDFTGFYDTAYAVGLQADGKLVVSGSAGTLPNTDFMLARYHDDGSLDAGFGDAGKVVADISGSDDAAQALAIQRDGKLVLAGYASIVYTRPDFAVVRYTSDGHLDASFGLHGVQVTDFGGYDAVESMALQIDGSIVVAGSTDDTDSDHFALARYKNDTPQVPPRIWLPVVIRRAGW